MSIVLRNHTFSILREQTRLRFVLFYSKVRGETSAWGGGGGGYPYLFFCGPVSMLFSQSDCFVCGPVFHDTDRSTGPLRIANLQ